MRFDYFGLVSTCKMSKLSFLVWCSLKKVLKNKRLGGFGHFLIDLSDNESVGPEIKNQITSTMLP